MNRNGILFTLAIAVSALTVSDGSAQEAKLLRWKFQPQEKLKLRFDQTIVQDAKVNDQPLKTTIDLGLEIGWLVEAVDASGEATIVQSIDRVQASMETPLGGKATYDSSEAKRTTQFARSVHDAVQGFLGLKVRQRISARGEVLSAEDAGEKAATSGAFSKENLQRILSQAAIVLPESAVEPGYAWEQKIGGSTFGLTYSGERTIDGRSLSQIDMTVTLAAPASVPDRPSLKIIDQKGAGVFSFDGEAGRIVASETHSSATVETSRGGETVSSSLETTTKLSVASAE